jgi:hypothetical protein
MKFQLAVIVGTVLLAQLPIIDAGKHLSILVNNKSIIKLKDLFLESVSSAQPPM